MVAYCASVARVLRGFGGDKVIISTVDDGDIVIENPDKENDDLSENDDVSDEDKEEALPLLKRFYDLGFNIAATIGTAMLLAEHGIKSKVLRKLSEGSEEILEEIRSGKVSYVINTRAIFSGVHYDDGVAIRKCTIQNNITMLTSLDTVRALLDVLEEVNIGVSVI